MTTAFLLLALITLVAAGAAMMLRGLVHSALALAVAFAGIGTLYLNFGAQFLGLAQLLVYVGAVAVLIVFVILLTRGDQATVLLTRQRLRAAIVPTVVVFAVFGVLVWAILHSAALHGGPGTLAPESSTRALGFTLMGSYVFPLEMIGLLLTAALIGAVIIAMKEKTGPR